MKKNNEPHRAVRILGLSLLLINGLSAIAGGMLFMVRPDGTLMGVTPHLLDHSPFANFLFPGVLLLVFNGVSSLVIAFLGSKDSRHFPLLICLQGLLLGGWLIVQVIMLENFSPQHMAMGIIAFVMILCGVLLKWR